MPKKYSGTIDDFSPVKTVSGAADDLGAIEASMPPPDVPEPPPVHVPTLWETVKQAAIDSSPAVLVKRENLPITAGALSAALTGGTSLPLSMLAAGLGGAAGEGFGQATDAAGITAPGGASLPDAAKAMLTQGAIQGAAEGAGGLIAKGVQAVARPAYQWALRPYANLRKNFGLDTLIDTGLNEGIPVTAKGTAKAEALRGASAQEAQRLVKAASSDVPAPSAATAPASFAPTSRMHVDTPDDLFERILVDARKNGYTGTANALKRELNARYDEAHAVRSELRGESAAYEPSELFQAIKEYGGIGADDANPGEIKWLWENSSGVVVPKGTTKTGRLMRMRTQATGGLGGVTGVLKKTGGKDLDMMAEALRQDPRFQDIASPNDLLDAIAAATGKRRGTAGLGPSDLERVGVKPGSKWWEGRPDDLDLSFDPATLETPPAPARSTPPVPPVSVREISESPQLNSVRETMDELVRLGRTDEADALSARMAAMQRANPNGISVADAHRLKQVAQGLADKAYRAERAGAPVPLALETEEAIASSLQKAIETRVPSIKGVNQRTKGLIGLSRALKDAEGRTSILGTLLAISGGLGTGAAATAAGGPAAGVMTGLKSAALMKAVTSPAVLSRGAILAHNTNPAVISTILRAFGGADGFRKWYEQELAKQQGQDAGGAPQ